MQFTGSACSLGVSAEVSVSGILSLDSFPCSSWDVLEPCVFQFVFLKSTRVENVGFFVFMKHPCVRL